MKTLRNCTVALLLGLSAPVLIWVGAGAALVSARREKMAVRQPATCSVDADCPPGFVCIGGRCTPAHQ